MFFTNLITNHSFALISLTTLIFMIGAFLSVIVHNITKKDKFLLIAVIFLALPMVGHKVLYAGADEYSFTKNIILDKKSTDIQIENLRSRIQSNSTTNSFLGGDPYKDLYLRLTEICNKSSFLELIDEYKSLNQITLNDRTLFIKKFTKLLELQECRTSLRKIDSSILDKKWSN